MHDVTQICCLGDCQGHHFQFKLCVSCCCFGSLYLCMWTALADDGQWWGCQDQRQSVDAGRKCVIYTVWYAEKYRSHANKLNTHDTKDIVVKEPSEDQANDMRGNPWIKVVKIKRGRSSIAFIFLNSTSPIFTSSLTRNWHRCTLVMHSINKDKTDVLKRMFMMMKHLMPWEDEILKKELETRTDFKNANKKFWREFDGFHKLLILPKRRHEHIHMLSVIVTKYRSTLSQLITFNELIIIHIQTIKTKKLTTIQYSVTRFKREFEMIIRKLVWKSIQNHAPGIAVIIKNLSLPKEEPSLIRTIAAWYMVMGKTLLVFAYFSGRHATWCGLATVIALLKYIVGEHSNQNNVSWLSRGEQQWCQWIKWCEWEYQWKQW